MFNAPAYWNNTLYFWGVSDVLKSIPITNGLPDFTHVTGKYTSDRLSGSRSLRLFEWDNTRECHRLGDQFNPVWFTGPGPGPAVLYAYDATNIPINALQQRAKRDARCGRQCRKIRGSHYCQWQGICWHIN